MNAIPPPTPRPLQSLHYKSATGPERQSRLMFKISGGGCGHGHGCKVGGAVQARAQDRMYSRCHHPTGPSPPTPHPLPLTPFPSPHTPHPTPLPLTPYPTPRTPHPLPLTPHPSPHTLQKHLMCEAIVGPTAAPALTPSPHYPPPLSDFGLCELLNPQHSHVSNHDKGTPFYMAPETIMRHQVCTHVRA